MWRDGVVGVGVVVVVGLWRDGWAGRGILDGVDGVR